MMPPVAGNSKISLMTQNKFTLALYTVKSMNTALVALLIQSPSFSSWMIILVSFFREWKF